MLVRSTKVSSRYYTLLAYWRDFSDAQKEIYEIVLDAQEKAIDACRVGNPYNMPHEVARKALAEGLIRLE